MALALFVLLTACSGHSSPIKPVRTLGVITALPLFFGEEETATLLSAADTRAPILTAIEPEFLAQPVDEISTASLARYSILLLIQPRALSPTELVTIDKWIRKGGRALMFVDPDLKWPSRYPIGDRRRAPITTLLDPLLTHWGLTLDLRSDAPREHPLAGQVITLSGAGRWSASGNSCQIYDDGLRASCNLEKGSVELVADADLLDISSKSEASVVATKKILNRLSEVH